MFGKFFSKIDKNKNILVKDLRRDADPPKVPKLGTQWAKSTPRHPGRNPKRTQLKSEPPKNDILRISTEHQHLTPAQTHTQTQTPTPPLIHTRGVVGAMAQK